MQIDILSVFPEMFENVFSSSMLGRAVSNNLITVYTHNIRDYTDNKHKKTDDYPFGGGNGLVMMAQPIFDAIDSVKSRIQSSNCKTVLMTPRGKRLSTDYAKELSKLDNLIILCGHYEGVDERVNTLIDEEISIGDYILTGGELPAMVLVDCLSRFIPGVLGNPESSEEESFSSFLLEYPQYTHPSEWNGRTVPEVLLSGHHQNVDKWRREQSLKRTLERRPDMLEKADLSKDDKKLLASMLNDKE